MPSLPIKEVESLKILGFYFDKKLTWNTMISQLSTRCRQRMGALFRMREYLGPNGLAVAFRSFVRPVCEYGGVAFMGASATHLSKFDKMQKLAERISGRVFPTLQSRRAASAIGLLCKLLDFCGRGPLQLFCPNFVNPATHSYSLRSVNTDSLLLSSTIQFNLLDLFRRSFFGVIIDICMGCYLDRGVMIKGGQLL